jgi:UPF0716 family protein affecting phage T7 exclusion
MKPSPATSEKLKFIGGAIIVLAAAAIMFPGFLTVAMGLWRIFLILVVVGGSSLAIAYATRHFARLKAAAREQNSGLKQDRASQSDAEIAYLRGVPAGTNTDTSGLPPAATE